MSKAVQAGFDQKLLLSRSNLTAAELSNPDTRIPREKLSRLWIAIDEEYHQPYFGLEVGKSVLLQDLGIVGYTMSHSETLGHAMSKLERFGKLLSDDVAISIDLESGAPQVRLEASIKLIAIRHPIHCRIAIIVAIARQLTTPDLTPRRIQVPELLTKDADALSDFFQCNVTLGDHLAIVVFEEADWNRPIERRDPKLETYLDAYAEHLLNKRPSSDNLVEQIEFALSSNLAAGEPGLSAIASYLGISVRSLQRRLTAAQTSYKQVLDDFRRTQALDFLSDRRHTIQEVASMLGYHEPSGFYRAFHRWMGCPPNQYRDQKAKERR
tara:strand:- start:22374 stop:23348 length:975 start_codon:yes stop_codon:yes gene_type:complete